VATLTATDPGVAARERAFALPESLRSAMLDAMIVIAACIVFLGISLYQIQLPGLYTDEAFDVIPAMQLLTGHAVELQRNIGLHLFGYDLPLMSSSDYQGVTSTYLVLPFFALGGINVVSLRLMTISVGILGVILTYFLARAWFGRGVARLAVVLIAVSPAWIFWSRLGVYVVSQVMPIATGSLLAFTSWVHRRPVGERNASLYLGTFLLGLGLTTKLLFIWFIAAAGLVALILWGSQIWQAPHSIVTHRGKWVRIGLTGSIWFAVGAAPFLVYNILSGGTFDLLRHTLSAPGTTSYGVSNSAILRNLWTEADSFKVLLDGGYFWFQGVAGAVYSNPLTPLFFVISAIGLVVILLLEHGELRFPPRGLRQPGAFILAASLLIALFLAAGLAQGSVASLLILLAGALCVAGTVLLVRKAFRDQAVWLGAACLLLVTSVLAGACWWFLGSGRPDGRAPGALIGLWPIDGAGVFFWCSGLGLVVLLGIDMRPARLQRPITAMLALIGLIVAQSSVTVSGLWSTHLLMLLPLPQITIAAFALLAGARLVAFAKRFRNLHSHEWTAPAFGLLFVGLIVLLDLNVARQYQRDMTITGGTATFSDAIYSLSAYLDNQQARPHVVALDWGFKRPVEFLTLDRVNPDDAFGYEQPASQATQEAIAQLVKEPNTLFLFHTPQAGIAYPRFDIFAAAARAAGKQPVLERTFYERDGPPMYQVYSVR
jgi:hypothetical protein